MVSSNLHSSHKKLQSHWEMHLTREQITLALEPFFFFFFVKFDRNSNLNSHTLIEEGFFGERIITGQNIQMVIIDHPLRLVLYNDDTNSV
jgi:hypothetical protein